TVNSTLSLHDALPISREIYGEFLLNAQGEDVVAGIRTPQPLTERARTESSEDNPSLEMLMPELFGKLAAVFSRLESHYRDMQDRSEEHTSELQSRSDL